MYIYISQNRFFPDSWCLPVVICGKHFTLYNMRWFSLCPQIPSTKPCRSSWRSSLLSNNSTQTLHHLCGHLKPHIYTELKAKVVLYSPQAWKLEMSLLKVPQKSNVFYSRKTIHVEISGNHSMRTCHCFCEYLDYFANTKCPSPLTVSVQSKSLYKHYLDSFYYIVSDTL